MDHLDETVKCIVSRRALVELHHLYGEASVKCVTDAFLDELLTVIEGLQASGAYKQIVDEFNAKMAKLAQDEKERS